MNEALLLSSSQIPTPGRASGRTCFLAFFLLNAIRFAREAVVLNVYSLCPRRK
jgi:hypothetical protein